MIFTGMEENIIGDLNIKSVVNVHAKVLTVMEGRLCNQSMASLSSYVLYLKSSLSSIVLTTVNKLHSNCCHVACMNHIYTINYL
jgi:hypothetical protein